MLEWEKAHIYWLRSESWVQWPKCWPLQVIRRSGRASRTHRRELSRIYSLRSKCWPFPCSSSLRCSFRVSLLGRFWLTLWQSIRASYRQRCIINNPITLVWHTFGFGRLLGRWQPSNATQVLLQCEKSPVLSCTGLHFDKSASINHMLQTVQCYVRENRETEHKLMTSVASKYWSQRDFQLIFASIVLKTISERQIKWKFLTNIQYRVG